MSERDGFGNGFVLGTLVGSVIGGVIGAIAASRQKSKDNALSATAEHSKDLENGESIESARRSLEEKISQLNLAIDDVRQQLGTTESNSTQD